MVARGSSLTGSGGDRRSVPELQRNRAAVGAGPVVADWWRPLVRSKAPSRGLELESRNPGAAVCGAHAQRRGIEGSGSAPGSPHCAGAGGGHTGCTAAATTSVH